MNRPILVAAALVFAIPALAADNPGDPNTGKTLVYTCAGCHGITGWNNAYPDYHVPKIGGQNYKYIVDALNAYKKGDRSHPTMRAQGDALSETEIQDIAAYLSSLSPTSK
ncbi:MAG: cytochrome c [Lysobacterales bacterium]